ncbi:hypothetical protein DRO54_02535 [Candidatus Bathyarchaeota archaeon]|nr:MAG: hypothetical protein DRO54_02535 [Candidatus Bathyarchaeota archaeon]
MSKSGNELKSRMKNIFTYSFAVFYLISAGFFFYLLVEDLNMIHVGLIGILSLVTAIGVFRRESWSVWSAFLVFCGGNAFAISLLLDPLAAEIGGVLLQIGLIVYLILIWAAMLYLTAKRKEFY